MDIYIILINMTGFVVMGMDKARSRSGAWRISENKLLFIALAGGAVGMFLGMHCFRHKTRRLKFTITVPVIIIIQTIIYMYLINIIPF